MSSLDSGEEGGERPSRPDWWDEQEEEEEGEERKRVSGLRVIKYVFPTSPNTSYLKQTTNGMQDFPGSQACQEAGLHTGGTHLQPLFLLHKIHFVCVFFYPSEKGRQEMQVDG